MLQRECSGKNASSPVRGKQFCFRRSTLNFTYAQHAEEFDWTPISTIGELLWTTASEKMPNYIHKKSM
jgi:hypothetical protein